MAIATYNAQAHLQAAVASALAQTLTDIEVVIVDDCSTDDTVALAMRLAKGDPRVIVDRLPRNGGPAVARNRALTLARGDWFAVLDSDDLYVPDRLERLSTMGERLGADIVVDDLVVFDDADPSHAGLFLPMGTRSAWITQAEYLRRTVLCGAAPNLGYLKPVIRTDRLRSVDLRYDERLRIAEDDDFVLRLLAAGLRYWLEARPGYAYRRHGDSTSHRLSALNAAAMLAASERLIAAEGDQPSEVRTLLAIRHANLRRMEAFARLIDVLKARRMGAALSILWNVPATIAMLRMPIGAALRRVVRRPVVSMVRRSDPVATAIIEQTLAPGISE